MRKVQQHSSRPQHADPAGQFRLVPNPDLAHLDAGAKVVGEVLDQFAKVDPAIGGEVEDDLRAVEQVLGPHQLHRHFPLLNPLQAEAVGLFLSGGIQARIGDVLLGGLAQDVFEVLGSLLGGNLFRWQNDRSQGPSPVGFHDHVVAGFQVEPLGVEMVAFAGIAEFDRNDANFLLGRSVCCH